MQYRAISSRLSVSGCPSSVRRAAALAAVGCIAMSGGKTFAAPLADGLKLWLDATDSSSITESGGAVSQWSDKSGNGNHATISGSQQPTLTAGGFNGSNTIRFDGIDDSLTINNLDLSGGDYTIFTAEKYYGNPGRLLHSSMPGNNWLMGLWNGNNSYYNGDFVSANNPAGTTPWIHEGNNSNSTGISSFVQNGVVTNSGGRGGTTPRTLELNPNLNFSGERSQSDISEVLVYDRLLSHWERAQVGKYITQKYSVGIPTAPGAVTDYIDNLPTRARSFTGGDAGEGLDFQGTFKYAVQANGPGGQTIGNANFTTDSIAGGATITSEHSIASPGWITPSYGTGTAADSALSDVMRSIRWTQTGNSTPDAPNLEDLTIAIPDLTVGKAYKVQMLFGDRGTARHWGITANGSPLIRDFSEAAIGGNNPESPSFSTRGVVLTHEFIATSASMNLVFSGVGLGGGDLNPIINAFTVEDRGVVGTTSANTFTGSAAGQGLDLQGNFKYAVNVQGPAVGMIGNANFTDENAAGVHLYNASATIANWATPNFGAGAEDQRLATVMQSIRHNGNPAGGTISIDLDDVSPGTEYKLQLLFTESCCGGRGFDVSVDGVLVGDDFSPAALAGVNGAPTQGAVFTYDFIADADGTVNIALDGIATNFGDKNPIISGLTLEVVPEPTSLSLLGLAVPALLSRRRRSR